MNECACAGSELLVWQLLFLAMACIALVLAILAEPVSSGWDRLREWMKRK